MASLDWQQGPLEDTGRGPQSCPRLAAAVKKQKKLVSHVSGDDDDDDDDDADDDENDPNETCKFRDEISSRNGQVFPT